MQPNLVLNLDVLHFHSVVLHLNVTLLTTDKSCVVKNICVFCIHFFTIINGQVQTTLPNYELYSMFVFDHGPGNQ